MSSTILGISAFYHDSAACLVRDGEIVAAAQEERFTRKKHDHNFPSQAADFCLKQAGIGIDEVDYVAFYDKPWIKFERLLETYLAFAPVGIRSFMKSMPIWLKEKLWMGDLIKRELGFSGELIYPEHHQSHAASAFFPSPFESAAILSIDGVGEWTTTSWGVGKGNLIDLQFELRFPHSLGLLYSAFTYYTGFKVNSGEIVGLVGPSGSGKSVLLKLIANVEQPDAGEIEVATENGEEARVGFQFQESALFDSMTVLENVAFPLSTSRTDSVHKSNNLLSHNDAMERAYEVLKQVGLGKAYLKYPGQLSGGMRRRAGIARALVARPQLVLLDDPTGGLDPVAASVIMKLIHDLHADYLPTVLIVSHDLRRLLPSVERVLCLFSGKIVCDEKTPELAQRANPEVLHFLSTRYDFSATGQGNVHQ